MDKEKKRRRNEPINCRRHAPTVSRPLRYLQGQLKDTVKRKTSQASTVLHIAGETRCRDDLCLRRRDSFNLDDSRRCHLAEYELLFESRGRRNEEIGEKLKKIESEDERPRCPRVP